MSACCSEASLNALVGLTRMIVDHPDAVSAACNGTGVALTVAPEDQEILLARHGQTLRALSRVHRALCGNPESSVVL